MTKWEYCEIELQYGGGVWGQGWFYHTDGKHKEFEAPKYGKIIADLGLQGWELVAASTHASFTQTHANTVSYIFKRPLPEQ